MNGRSRIAFCGAAATMLTALCQWPLVTPTGWLFQAGFLVLVLTGAGLGLRRMPLPRPVVPVLQLLVALVLLTVFYARGKAIGGVLPGPGALRALGDLIRSGVDDMTQYSAPAPAHSGLTLILVGAVVLIGLLVDLIAVTYQRVALAGLPLLALYSVGTGLHPKETVWFWFLLAALGYLALLQAEGQDRLSRWGRVFHGTPATLAGSGGGNPLSSTGYRIAGLALVAGLLLPLGLPSLDNGLLGRIDGGSGIGGSTIITSVNPLASLASSLSQQSGTDVLRYTTNASGVGDQYLRIVDLDQFNGTAWSPGGHSVVSVPVPMPTPTGLSSDVITEGVQTRITTVPGYVQQWLPMPYPALTVTTDGDWRYEPDGRTLVGAKGQTAGGLTYTVVSESLKPTIDQLRAAGKPPADIAKNYLSLPKGFPSVITSDAQNVTRNAATPYDKAVALQNWFTTTGGFSYSTSVKPDTGSDAMVSFLRNRQGFCVHFASTMAAMARSLGIPARLAVGFTPGTKQPDGSWTVSTKDAHAWPELYFAGAGWLRFEPTPSRGSAPDYTVAATNTTTVPKPSVSLSAGAVNTAGPRASGGCTSEIQRRTGGCGSENAGAGGSATTADNGLSPLTLALIAAGGLLILVLLTPMLWRLRVRNRRLRRRPGGRRPPERGELGGERGGELSEDQVLAAWYELIDSAWDLGIPPDEAETPRRIAARIVELGELEDEPRAAAGRLALATERALYAPSGGPHPALRQDVRAVRSGLRASAGRMARVRAVVLPPSAARLRRGIRETVGSALARTFGLFRRPWRKPEA